MFIKSKVSKLIIWMLDICGILVFIATIDLLAKEGLDKNTIFGTIEEKSKHGSLRNDLKQWAKDNPKDAKSFNQWTEGRSKKLKRPGTSWFRPF